MLTNETKRKVLLKLRTENYRASLRLEGMAPRPIAADKPVTERTEIVLNTKHAR